MMRFYNTAQKTFFLISLLIASFYTMSQSAVDVGIVEVYTPLGNENEGALVDVSVELMNFGTDTIYALDLAFVLNGNVPVVTSWAGSLAPASSDSIVLSSLVVPVGYSTICTYSILATDSNATNDTLCKSFSANPLNDAGITTLSAVPEVMGTYPIYASIINQGVLPLQSTIIEWKVGSVLQTSISWNGTLAPGLVSAPVLLGYVDFTDPAVLLQANTSLPNGVIDNQPQNDTVFNEYNFIAAAIVDSFPYCESFELNFDNWIQNTWDDFDWTQDANGTPTNNTGPSNAIDGSFYMYAESSSPQQQGDVASIEVSVDLSNNLYEELVFNYHMYGATMGDLHVDVFDTVWHYDVWSMSGNQGNSWYQANIGLLEFGGMGQVVIRIWAERGNGTRSDIAIDNLCLNTLDPTDIAVSSLNNGITNLCSSTTMDFSVDFENVGALAQSNIPVQLSVLDPTGIAIIYLDTIVGTVNPLSTVSHTFQNIDLSQAGSYEITSVVSLSGDVIASNDTLMAEFYVAQPITVFPFVEDFEQDNDYFKLESASLSAAMIYTDTISNESMLRFTGGDANQLWTGQGGSVTAENAWIDNAAHMASAVTCTVDASLLVGLLLELDLKQTNTFGNIDYSWFRVLINDTVQLADVNGVQNFNATTPVNDNFQMLKFDLSPYIGTIFTLSLQASVKYNESYNSGYPQGDQVLIDNFTLYEPAPYDVAVIEIIHPVGQICGGNVYVQAVVQNVGILDVSNIPVQVKSTSSFGVTTFNNNIPQTLSSGDTHIINVGQFSMNAADTYVIEVEAMLATDGNSSNNIFVDSATTIYGINAFPFAESFSSQGTDYFHLSESSLATAYYYNDNGDYVLRMEGGPTNAGWSGSGNNTLPQNAWVDNVQHHAFAKTCSVDASSLSSLHLDVDFRQAGIMTYTEYSWFRVMLNDSIQLTDLDGNTNFNPSQPQGDPYKVRTFDLSAYTGSAFTLSFQSACKYDSTFTFSGVSYPEGDAVFIRGINLYEPPAVDIKLIAIDGVPEPDCDLAFSSVSVSFINNGLNTLYANDVIPFFIGINTIAFPESFTLPLDLAFRDTATYVFTTMPSLANDGLYEITVWSDYPGDMVAANNELNVFTENILTVDTYPYLQSFELDANGWRSTNEAGVAGWELGTPSQTVLSAAHSGISAWMTGISDNYADEVEAYLYAPCFNFSNVLVPRISFWIAHETDADLDGAILEGSADNGATWSKVGASDTSFYSSFNNGSPNPVLQQPWWSGSSNGWSHVSAFASEFANEPNVKFRFRFQSDEVNNDEGVLIDDFKVEDVFLATVSSSELEICEGDSVQLTVDILGGVPPFNYAWSPSHLVSDSLVSNPFALPNESTNFIVMLSDATGRVTYGSVHVDVLPEPPLDLGTDIEALPPVVLDAGPDYIVYAWSTLEATQTIEVTVTGEYSVFVVDENGCDASDDIYVTITNSINEINNEELRIYPNPATDVVTINSNLKAAELVLTDISGKVLKSCYILTRPSEYKLKVDDLAAGTYFVQLKNEDSIQKCKLIIE